MSKVYTDNIEKRTGGTAMAVPATGKWPTANIADDAITATQIAADAVGTSEIAANAVDTSEIAADAVTSTELADNAVVNTSVAAAAAIAVSKLETGTRGDTLFWNAATQASRLAAGTSGQFLKTQGSGADPVWAAAGGDNTPAFFANLVLSPVYQVIPDGAATKITFNTEIFDTDNTYDATTNYRWTPGVLGKYYMYTYIVMERASGAGIYRSAVYIKKNGTTIASDYFALVIDGSNATWKYVLKNMAVTDTVTDVADYYEVYLWPDTTDGADAHVYAQAPNTGSGSSFGGWKLIT